METSNELTLVIQESGVEQSTALTLQNSFMPFFEQAKEWNEKAKTLIVKDVSQTREMKMAREARLALADIRVAADKTRKALKEDSLRYGKAVQGVYNVIEYLIKPTEKYLEEQEKFVEIQEAKRKAELKATREMDLQPFIEFVPYQIDLGELTEDAWQKVLSGAKLQMQAKLEADRKAEEERIETARKEAEERERIRLENERLKAEAIEREKKAAEELAEQKRLAEIQKKKQEELIAKAEAERKALEEKNRAEQAERDRLAKIELDKAEAARKAAEDKAKQAAAEQDELNRKAEIARQAAAKALEQERAASAKLAAELKAKQDAEAKAEAERIAAEKKLAKAPEKDQLRAWLDSIKFQPIPVTKSDEAQVIAINITEKFSAFKKWAISQIETL